MFSIGALAETIAYPAEYPTKVAFGRRYLSDLYVTSKSGDALGGRLLRASVNRSGRLHEIFPISASAGTAS